MTRRLLLTLSWLAFIAAALLVACGAIMLANGVPDAAGAALVLAGFSACAVLCGAGLRFVAGRPG